MDELKQMLPDEQLWDTRRAVRMLSPEIHVAAERIRKRRQERLQLLGFLLAALVMVVLIAVVAWDLYAHGSLAVHSRSILTALAVGAGLTLAFAPVLAYFAEEDMNHEEA